MPHTYSLQGVLVSYIGKLRVNTTKWTDERVRLAGEAVVGCLAVKMLGGLRKPSAPIADEQRCSADMHQTAAGAAQACVIPVDCTSLHLHPAKIER